MQRFNPLRSLFAVLALSAAGLAATAPAGAALTLDQLVAGWTKPARTYKPHTRWWWPGNALTRADITFQLEQMAAQGLGGVEIMSAWRMYAQGNHDYLSPEFLALVQHAVAEARRLDLEVALTFSPGWSFGGPAGGGPLSCRSSAFNCRKYGRRHSPERRTLNTVAISSRRRWL
jgi:hypothetical protein